MDLKQALEKAATPQIVKKNESPLVAIVKDSGLVEAKAKILLDNFSNYFEIAADWEHKARAIVVTDSSQIAEMDMARTGRLFLREKRISIERTRKQLKEQALREGKAIDGIANVLKALIVPIEEYLKEQEDFVKIQKEREAEQIRLEAEQKAEEERIAKEKAEAEERERIRAENERLRKEAEETEKQLAKEREALEAERKKKAEEQRVYEEKLRKEREEHEMKLRKEQEAAEVVRKQAKKEAEEKKQLQEQLENMIECPFCHKKFKLNQ